MVEQKDSKFLEKNSRMKIKDIKKKAQKKWNVGVNKTKAIRSRFGSRDMVSSSFLGDYTRIYNYFHEILRKKSGSTVNLNVQHVQEGIDDQRHHFRSLYICYVTCKERIKLYRHFIGLNGCFFERYLLFLVFIHFQT